MALVASIDGPSRRIFLSADSVGVDVHPMDIYKEVRALRRLDESLRKFSVFLEGRGNDPKGAGAFTERFVRQLAGTRIVPFDASHTLKVTGTIITDDGQSGIACFDRSLLSVSTVVDIDYQPPQVEVIVISSGSGLSPAQAQTLDRIAQDTDDILGLTQ